MLKNEIEKLIQEAVVNLQKQKKLAEFDLPKFAVNYNKDSAFGDYSTTIALQIGKIVNKNSAEIAEMIRSQIKSDLFSKIEIVNGYINFFVADKIFVSLLKGIDDNFGKGADLKNKKVIIDYTDTNPLKEFHIGHLMSNAIGESLSRIFEFQGAKLKRVCYSSDVGVSTAKAVWGILQNKNNFPKESDSLSDKIKFLGNAYAFGSEKYENDETAKKEIIALNKKIFERSDDEVNKFYDTGKKWSLEHFDIIFKKIGTKFDYQIFESEVSDLGKKIVEKGLKNGIFETGENGAIIFKGENVGLHTRVFISSEGLPTYEAKDLALAEIKYKKYAYDKSVVVTGNEVNEYFKVMLAAMARVAPKLAEKQKHIGHGMLRLPEGKMSSRTGRVVSAESLIEKVQDLVAQKLQDRELPEKEKKEIAEGVAIGAIRYSILKQSIGSDIIYDFDKSISFEGDSGPYLQYSYVRAKSVLRKAKAEGIKASFKNFPDNVVSLEKMMLNFPDIVEKAGREYQPHYIVLYLTELAGSFNSYYAGNKIVDKSDKLSPYRVAITKAFTEIMKNGMWLIGINPLERM